MSEGSFCRLAPAALPLLDRSSLPESTRAELEAIVASHRTLEDVTRWALFRRPPLIFHDALTVDSPELSSARRGVGFDLVVQDEYTQDFVVPYDTKRRIYLVYDTT